MKTFKFLSGAVCLFLFITSCESEPILEDTDIVNSKLGVAQELATIEEAIIDVKPNEQIAKRTDGEDDDPDRKQMVHQKPILMIIDDISRSEGEDDDPDTSGGN